MGKSLRSSFKSHSHKRLTFAFTLEIAYTHSSSLTRAHTAAHTRKQGVFQMGSGIRTLNVRYAVRNLCARSGQKSILCHFCMGRWDVEKKQRAFGTETRIVRVSVLRRRGPAGPRCSAAGSCVVPASCEVCHRCDEGQREDCWRVCCAFICGVGCSFGAEDSSLVTAVRFWSRCLHRSTRGTCPSERRSGCRF